MMPLRPAFTLCLLTAIGACAQFPDLDSALSDSAANAAYPDLMPVENLNARVDEPRIAPETATGIEARVASLRARATRLRGTVIDSPTRARMSTGVTEF